MRPVAAAKLFFVIVLCTIYLISVSQIGPTVYESLVANDTDFAAGTIIGSVSVASFSKEEAAQKLQAKVNEWKTSAQLTLIYQEKTVAIPTRLFTFRVEQSVQQAVNGHPSQLVVQLDKEAVSALAEQLITPALASSLQLDKLANDIMKSAALLQRNREPFDLARYIGQQATERTAVSVGSITNLREQKAEVIAWVEHHSSIEIKGKTLLSLAAYMKGMSSLAMSTIASAVYQAILPTNFTVVERHTSRSLPDGIPLGYEAKVDGKISDLRVYNPNTTAYTLQFQTVGNGFRVTLYGLPFAYQYVIKTGEVEYFPPKTVVQYNPSLKPGERYVKDSGRQGMLVKVKKETYDENKQLVGTEVISEDFYPPVHATEVRGLELGTAPTNETENPSSSETQNNEQTKTPTQEEQPNESDQYEK
ncbi:G5 domain-containing protein [Anoxybacteroides amylolyticum]|uniref:VanW like family protein n=1 Tax=Anoxybacteroides amylolyticum TaxID=294699 RepID=A0A160F3V0_9BACL|nr:G5 domain-containing protein [Anoxybacillus amylolyticus]ANB61047.1 vanW like family protein [Anoxybacillus amylolyticus]